MKRSIGAVLERARGSFLKEPSTGFPAPVSSTSVQRPTVLLLSMVLPLMGPHAPFPTFKSMSPVVHCKAQAGECCELPCQDPAAFQDWTRRLRMHGCRPDFRSHCLALLDREKGHTLTDAQCHSAVLVRCAAKDRRVLPPQQCLELKLCYCMCTFLLNEPMPICLRTFFTNLPMTLSYIA